MDASLSGPFGRVTLTSTNLTIGRLPTNQLVVTDPKTSSRHAEIRSTGTGYTITDLGSTNGTLVNDQPLERDVPRPLNSGDVIRIGDTRITYEASGMPQVEPTVYANQGNGAGLGYDPTMAAPPVPSANTAYGSGNQQNYQHQSPSSSYSQPQPAYGQPPAAPPYGYPALAQTSPRKSNRPSRTLLIILGSVLGAIVLLCVIISAFVYVNRSTPEKTLGTFCNGLKNKDYQTAYSQLARSIQNQVTEGQFESAFTGNNTPQITNCTVSNTYENGSTGSGALNYSFNNGRTVTQDYKLAYEDNVWKISSGTNR